MKTTSLTLAAMLLASTAIAQNQSADVPSAAEIQNSQVIDDGRDVPEIPAGTQSADVETDPVASPKGAKAASGEGDTAATETVEEIVEDAKTDPETGQVEAATGGAEPTENWFGCKPDQEGQDAHCDEETAEAPGTDTIPDAEAEVTRNAGDADSVHEPEPENPVAGNLIEGDVGQGANAGPTGTEDAATSELGEPRTQSLGSEPQGTVKPGDADTVDLEAEGRVEPESETAADLPDADTTTQ